MACEPVCTREVDATNAAARAQCAGQAYYLLGGQLQDVCSRVGEMYQGGQP